MNTPLPAPNIPSENRRAISVRVVTCPDPTALLGNWLTLAFVLRRRAHRDVPGRVDLAGNHLIDQMRQSRKAGLRLFAYDGL